MNKKSRFYEILRFAVTGVVATIVDFAVSYVLRFAFKNNWNAVDSAGEFINPSLHYVATGICVTAGFLVSLVVNWFMSKLWVFQNVDKEKNYNKAKYVWGFIGLSVGGFALGTGLMVLGEYICGAAWGITYPSNPFDENIWGNLFKTGGLSFWAYFIMFALKTLIVLVYNYLTRKFFIFKEPKKVENIENNDEQK